MIAEVNEGVAALEQRVERVLVEQVERANGYGEIVAKARVRGAYLVTPLGEDRHGDRAELAGSTRDQDAHQRAPYHIEGAPSISSECPGPSPSAWADRASRRPGRR